MDLLAADVIVIAAGPSGLTAAITAAQNGAKVIVLEKANTTGGSGNLAAGLLAVESRHQRRKNLGPSREEAFKVFMDHTHWRVNARLVKAYIDKSAETIDWLEHLGVAFAEPATMFLGSYPTWHLIDTGSGQYTPQAASAMVHILTTKAKEAGVRILFRTPARKIITKGKKIIEVIGEDGSGNEIHAQGRAVIIATGGFGDNPQMIKKYTGHNYGLDLFSYRIPGLEGDGIRMAWEVGAGRTEMNMELVYGMPGDLDPEVISIFREPHLLVNQLGERFLDEDVMRNPGYTGNAISLQKNKCAYLIFDETILINMEQHGLDCINHVFSFTQFDKLALKIENAVATGAQSIFMAESLEELAIKAGIDAAGLLKTVKEYNCFCEKGHDPQLNKNRRYLRPIKEPRYYAGRQNLTGYGTLGGIKINHKTEVLTKDDEVIPGLYASGTDACSIFGDSYVFILPGNTLGFAVNSGRIAGENAAVYAASTRKTAG